MSNHPTSSINRRTALGLLGSAGLGATAVTLGNNPAHAQTPSFHPRPGKAGAPPVSGLHLQFGADPSSQMTASWLTAEPVRNPRVLYGSLNGGFGSTARAHTRSYVDGVSQQRVYVHHAAMTRLRPNTDHVYAVQHDGAPPDAGTFRTAPRGRAPFTFTSFGDQATPLVSWTAANVPGLDGNSAPASKDVVDGVERVAPLFHLVNGDLCYANLDVDRVRTWNNWFTNNSRSARFRPWMPAAGNHENERANGPVGFGAFQTYFDVPHTESDAELAGLWYSFRVGSVAVVVIQNDDWCLQDGGDAYVRGYSGGRQLAWLTRTLAAARASRDVDWIVVCMHQVMVSSADFNGADLALRETLGPLFDSYQVDLVVCGHEHDYERSLAVRGVVSDSPTLTPKPASTARRVVDTSTGTVHMVLGGGGVSGTSNQTFFADGSAKVITSVGAPGSNGKRPSQFTKEQAVWSAVRDRDHPYGFAGFAVDPGNRPGGVTSMTVTYYNVAVPTGELSVFERFTLTRPRRDGHR